MFRLIFILPFLFFFACQTSENNVNSVTDRNKLILKELDEKYTPAYNRTIDIASYPTELDKYFRLLSNALELEPERRPKVRAVLLAFRQKRAGLTGDALQALATEREEAYAAILTPVEMAQKRFIHLRFNQMELKNPRQITNIQRTLNMTDGEVLKYIEIIELFKYNQDNQLLHNRLIELLGKEKYDKLVALGIFYIG